MDSLASSDPDELDGAVAGIVAELGAELVAGELLPLDRAKTLAKLHSASVSLMLKRLGQRLVPGLPPELAGPLSHAACAALNALDALRPALRASGTELEVQRYGFIRRLLAVGQHACALDQGWRLHAALSHATQPTGETKQQQQGVDLTLAAAVNLVVCAGELLSAGGLEGEQAARLVLRVLPQVQQLLHDIRCVSPPGAACKLCP